MHHDLGLVYAQMDSAVEVLKGLLSSAPQPSRLSDGGEGQEQLELETDLKNLSFEPIERGMALPRTLAVDGGQASIVRNPAVVVGICRACALGFRGRARTLQIAVAPQLAVLTRAVYALVYADAYRTCHQCEPLTIPDFDAVPAALRELAEARALRTALENCAEGDLLLIDGALMQSNDPGSGFLEGFLEKASERGVDVAAVSKSTSLRWRGEASLTGVLSEAGRGARGDASWYVHVGHGKGNTEHRRWLGEIYLARLHRSEELVFRVDLSSLNPSRPKGVLAHLGALATDPEFLGYPYPLAAVHREARIGEEVVWGLRSVLKQKALTAGIRPPDWELLFANYHDVLDRDLRQRFTVSAQSRGTATHS